MKLKFVQILGIAFALLLSAGMAHADTYTMTTDHCSSGGCLPSSAFFGTVVVTQGINSSTVDITVTLSPAGSLAFQENPINVSNGNGITGSFAFNLDLASPTISITGLPSGWGWGTNDQMDGAGTYEWAVQCGPAVCTTGQVSNPGSVTFSVVRTGGTLAPSDFATDGTGAGDFFAADVVSNIPGAGIRTGVISGSSFTPPTGTPEPGTLALFGSGLLGLAGIVRRKFALGSK